MKECKFKKGDIIKIKSPEEIKDIIERSIINNIEFMTKEMYIYCDKYYIVTNSFLDEYEVETVSLYYIEQIKNNMSNYYLSEEEFDFDISDYFWDGAWLEKTNGIDDVTNNLKIIFSKVEMYEDIIKHCKTQCLFKDSSCVDCYLKKYLENSTV